jgi:hypothetical protein
MEISSYLGDVRVLEADLVVAGVHDDERPPQGLAGAVDWFLCGRLTDLLISGRFTGARSSFALLATQGLIASPRFMLVGLGPRRELSPSVLLEVLPAVTDGIRGLRVQTAAVELLGTRGRVQPREAARLAVDSWRRESGRDVAPRLLVIPADEGQQELVEQLIR